MKSEQEGNETINFKERDGIQREEKKSGKDFTSEILRKRRSHQ